MPAVRRTSQSSLKKGFLNGGSYTEGNLSSPVCLGMEPLVRQQFAPINFTTSPLDASNVHTLVLSIPYNKDNKK